MAKKQPSPDSEPAAAGPDAEDAAALQDNLQQIQFAAAESYEKLSETAAQLAQQARGLYETSQDHVRQNPMGYVLGAFALGCLLGVALGYD